MMPRNSQLPCSRLTRLVCLPCQPMPAAALNGFSITGAVSTNTFNSLGARSTMNRASAFSALLDRLVIVAALRISGNAPQSGSLGERQRIAGRRIAHAKRDCRPGIRPQGDRRDALVGPLLHPAHRPVMPGGQPAPEIEPGLRRRIGPRKPAADEAKPGRFLADRLLQVVHQLADRHPQQNPNRLLGLQRRRVPRLTRECHGP